MIFFRWCRLLINIFATCSKARENFVCDNYRNELLCKLKFKLKLLWCGFLGGLLSEVYARRRTWNMCNNLYMFSNPFDSSLSLTIISLHCIIPAGCASQLMHGINNQITSFWKSSKFQLTSLSPHIAVSVLKISFLKELTLKRSLCFPQQKMCGENFRKFSLLFGAKHSVLVSDKKKTLEKWVF